MSHDKPGVARRSSWPASGYIYHERQLGNLCGVHCLNNLLQGPHFGPGDLAEIGVQLDREEEALFGGGLDDDSRQASKGRAYNVDSSADGGNFSIQVLTVALKRFGLELVPAKHPDAKAAMKDPPKAAEAFLCQYKDHWFAIREVCSMWWNLNSTRKRPGLVSPFLLAAWLGQLKAEGYSIFLVLGAGGVKASEDGRRYVMPEPAKPASEAAISGKDSAEDATFHELFALLEGGAKDNPLAGGDASSEVVIPPELIDEANANMGGGYGGYDYQPPIGQAGFGGACSSTWSQGREPHHVHSLREMGFSDAQIQAAMELSGGQVPLATEMLTRCTPAAHRQLSGEAFARAVFEAVQALDQNTAPPEAILRLVSLLSVSQESWRSAADHVDGGVLMNFLVSVVSQKQQVWSRQQVQAAQIAVDLLSMAPTRMGGSSGIRRPQGQTVPLAGGEIHHL
eukprot:TRINITY_DN90746_c0_g1_i1.p1 TRINITY_DN90746_c0_g1~~TRINITY_DN90746_c0_g1_i1.p1  ORF type:complete len:453 (-),score=101.46 TRINITY_DN90746_c0_g1_i1:72-1430(-)